MSIKNKTPYTIRPTTKFSFYERSNSLNIQLLTRASETTIFIMNVFPPSENFLRFFLGKSSDFINLRLFLGDFSLSLKSLTLFILAQGAKLPYEIRYTRY